MNSATLHGLGIIDDRQAALAALVADGWETNAATALLDRLTPPAPLRRAWTRWTPEMEEQLIALREEGRTNRQIAEAMGLPLGTVNGRINRLVGEGHLVPRPAGRPRKIEVAR